MSLLWQFQQLDLVLAQRQVLWRAQPFSQLKLDWEQQFPELSQWLRSRDLAAAKVDHLHPHLLQAPAPFTGWVKELHGLDWLPSLAAQAEFAVPQNMHEGIPGRKWQQIQAFAKRLAFREPAQRWLDWCSGKGYLGRFLACARCELSLLEYDPVLCQQAELLNQRFHPDACVHCADALSADAAAVLAGADSWAALHACGDLHTSLLRQVEQHPVRRIAVAPCCYNRMLSDSYQPLSSAGRGALLQPTRTDLALPMQSTVTAGARDERLRDQAMAWRLAFDWLQRQWRGVDTYLPVHSRASRWLGQDFVSWCHQVAEMKGLLVPGQVDWQQAQAYGWERLGQVRNLELVQCLYRRPLEVWLLLDMALFLQEQGFKVQLGTFCASALTPRNALLLAER